MARYIIDTETGEMVQVIDDQGREVLDPTPMSPPLGYQRQPSLSEQIRDMVRSEKLRLELEGTGAETFEEADDFEVGDDYDPTTPYENDFDPPISEMVREGEKALQERLKAEQATKKAKQKETVRQDPQQKQAPAPASDEDQDD